MKLSTITRMIAVVLALTAMTALADWDLGDPYKMHWPQLPDLVNGMNILAMEPVILADDFRCTQTGPITDIHLWGSWLDDIFPQDTVNGTVDPGKVGFHLSIHKDIPATASTHSMPGDLLWAMDFLPGMFKNRPWAISTERFYDPLNNVVIGFDTQVIQYNFLIDPADAFVQTAGEIYWLDVQAFAIDDPAALFGWKTSSDDFNDDSVWAQWTPGNPSPTFWNELIDPDTNESLHQAFVITPEPATLSLLALGGFAMLKRRRR